MDEKTWVWPRRLCCLIGLAALALVIIHTTRAHAPAPAHEALDGDTEPGSKRFDHFSIHNGSGGAVTDVVVWLQKVDGTAWPGCPATGFPVGTIPAGESRTWVFNLSSPAGVGKAICRVKYQKSVDPDGSGPAPYANEDWLADCTVDAYTFYDINSATFWFGNPLGPTQPAQDDSDPSTTTDHDHVMCGEALMTEDTPTTPAPRTVRPHWNAGNTKAP